MRNTSISKIAEALGCEGVDGVQVAGYQIDSRLIGPGDLFFALKGEKSDGHDFLKEVAGKGAVAAVVLRGYLGPDFGLILLKVDDVVAALQLLAHTLIDAHRPLIIGITGSLGKTMTKEFVSTLLSGKFKVGKTHLNFNTKLTYPITLLNRVGDEDVLVVELGMSEPKDMQKLVEIAAPDIAIVTKIARVHLANFPRGLLDIASGKAEIFENERTKTAIFDHGLYEYPEAIAKAHGKRVSFSIENQRADYFLSLESKGVDERGVRAFYFHPPFTQPHILHNFLVAVTVAREVGMSWDEIDGQVSKLSLPKMRLEMFEWEGVLFVNDAYNANPDSMKAALSSLPEPKNGGRKIAVLGMMVEMGPSSIEIHEEVGLFAKEHVDYLLTVGSGALPILEAFKSRGGVAEGCMEFESLSMKLQALIRPGDVVLVKGSRMVQMEKLFEALRICQKA